MENESEVGMRKERSPEETLTPFLERSITELIRLFAQLFTTPFAFLTYNKNFRDQITALAKDDLETAYPVTVARPLSFFVLLMGAHFLLSGIYWRLLFPAKSLSEALSFSTASSSFAATTNRLLESLDWLSGKIGSSQAVIVIAFVLTLIVAVKAFLVAMAGHLLRCRIRFETALRASAYAFGTFIFVQYVLIAIRFLAANIFGDPGFQFGYAVVIYGSLMISMLLVVRMNQLIRQVDGVTELASYSAWLLGTFVWHFGIVLGAIYMLRLGGLANYWSIYFQWLGLFGSALYPPSWYGGL